MDRRFVIFAVLVMSLFVVNQFVYQYFAPPPPPAPPAAVEPPKAAADALAAAKKQPEVKAAEAPVQEATQAPTPDAPTVVPARWITLGSANPDDPWRLLVTLTSRGAAVERIELSSPQYSDLEDRRGYLGYLAPTDAPRNAGAVVRVVGMGTPAAAAGVKVDDVITAVGETKIGSAAEFVEAIEESRPGDTMRLAILRDGATQNLNVPLRRHPLAVVRPEFESRPVELLEAGNHDPLSFLLTLQQFDDRTLGADSPELDGVHLHDSEWEVTSADQQSVSFRKVVLGLQVVKTYRVAKVPAESQDDPNFGAYHLTLDITITNVGDQAHEVAYRLDGPSGLPIEGAWYANKVSRTWSGAGLRDVIPRFEGGQIEQVTPTQLADSEFKLNWSNSRLDYIAVDAQYFAAALLPQDEQAQGVVFANVKPIRVGEVPKDKANIRLLDVSFRVESKSTVLAPGDAPLEQHFQIFAGPKKPALLAQYGPPQATLKDLLYYGWFGFVAVPLLGILHFFHSVLGNYGLAIIMLTVVVRGFMFPLSRKQVLSTQKMQELQPEMKRIAEKFKSEPEKRTRAQQDLFRQHNYNPMGGCLLGFVQAPVFIGLYRSLAVDVELRQAALFGDGVRWASNLAAPDMFWNWTAVMPEFVTQGTGIMALGPYLNIFPLITIALYIWQQKTFMPPPADEQAAMQQKMMQYMMIFMGVLFFKVASGLCLYLIASSLWGIIERRFMPKPATSGGSPSTGILSAGTPGGNGAAGGKRRQRGRK